MLADEIRAGEAINIEFKRETSKKSVIVVEIYPGASRPYYIRALGKESGTYIRVSGTSRHADEAILKDLELQGTNHSFDEMVCVEQKYDAEKAEELCAAIKNYMLEAARTKRDKEKVKFFFCLFLEERNFRSDMSEDIVEKYSQLETLIYK